MIAFYISTMLTYLTQFFLLQPKEKSEKEGDGEADADDETGVKSDL